MAAAVPALLAMGCQSGGEMSATSTTLAPAVATTLAAAPARGECFTEAGSSRADFDGRNGGFVVHMQEIDVDGRTLAFDVLQYLVGEDAVREYRRRNPTDSTGFPPNDYYIVNALVKTDRASVSANPTVWLRDLTDTTMLVRSNFEGLRTALRPRNYGPLGLYWLHFENANVARLCQIFTP